jgi:hypothetical protein
VAKQPAKAGQAWTPADNAALKKLAAGNTPTPLIAYKLERTEGAVRSHAADIDLSLKPTNKPPYGTQK